MKNKSFFGSITVFESCSNDLSPQSPLQIVTPKVIGYIEENNTKNDNSQIICKQSDSTKKEDNKTTNYYYPQFLAFCLNLGYYLGIAPIKITYDEKTQNFAMHTSVWQKRMYKITITGTAIYFLLRIARQFTFKITLDPANLFGAATTICSGLQFFVYVFVMWKKPKDVNETCNLVSTTSRPFYYCFAAVLFILAPFLYEAVWDFFDYNLLHPKSSGFPTTTDFSLWLVFQKDLNGSNKSIDQNYYKDHNWKIQLLNAAVLYFRWFSCLICSYIRLICGCCAFIILEMTFHLENSFKANEMHLKAMLKAFDTTREHLAIINSVFEYLTLAFFAMTVSLINFAIHIILNSDSGILQRINFSVWLLSLIVIIFIASEGHERIKRCSKMILRKLWLTETNGEGSNPVAANYLDALTPEMGMKGGEFFVITYGFAGLSLSVMVTYFLVLIQFIIPASNKI